MASVSERLAPPRQRTTERRAVLYASSEDAHPPSHRRTRRALLLGIILVAAALRVAAVGFGRHSVSFQADERFYNVAVPVNLSWRDLNPHQFSYPPLFWYALFVVDHVWFWIERQLGFLPASNLRELFDLNPIPFLLVGRSLNAMIGTATVGLLYLLGRRVAFEAQALFAAALLAVAFLHVRDSALATVDVPMTFFVVLSLFGSVAVLKRGRNRDYALAGVAAGLASSVKYNAVVVLGALAVAHVLRGARDGTALARRFGSPRLYAAVAIAGAVFLLLDPYFVLDWPEARDGLLAELIHQRQGQYADVRSPWWYHLSVSLRYGMGALPLGLALAGVVSALWRRDQTGLVLLGFAVPFFAIMSSTHAVFVRYMTPLVPVLCLFAGRAIGDATEWLHTPRVRFAAIAAIAVLAAAESLSASVAYAGLVHSTDTRVEAYRFIHDVLPPHSRVASYGPVVVWKATTPGLGDEVVHAGLVAGETWAERLNALRQRGVQYFLVHHSELDVFSPTIPELEEALRRSATLVAEFRFFGRTDEMPRPVYDEVDGFYFPIGHFRGVRRSGPLIQVYRLD